MEFSRNKYNQYQTLIKTLNSNNVCILQITTISLGNCLFRFQKRLRIVIIKCYQYTPQKKVSECFNVINKSLEMLDENVVYKYTCNVDQSISYIGKASRQKFRRVADNK